METTPSSSTPPTSSAPTVNSAPSRRSGRVPKPTPNPEQLLASPSASKSSAPKPMEPTPVPTVSTKPKVKGYDLDYKDKDKAKAKATTDNPTPWRHPDEFPFVSRADWSQDLMIEYMRYHTFSVPPREKPTSNQLIPILLWGSLPPSVDPVTSDSSLAVWLPRGYRVPLMFIAKFQWDSLRIVLNAPDPKADWDAFKFNILHLARLCQHLFEQARVARRKAVIATDNSQNKAVLKAMEKGDKEKAVLGGFDKNWRCPSFDRLLTRFYNKWFLSTDEWLEKFFNEFDEEEYHEQDVLKHDWIRWSVKGHKGFVLTKDEVQNGITAEQYMWGLDKVPDGDDGSHKWVWDSNRHPPQNTVSGWSIPGATSDPASAKVKREIIEYAMARDVDYATKSKISIDRETILRFEEITNPPNSLTTPPPARPVKPKIPAPSPIKGPTKAADAAASLATPSATATATASASAVKSSSTSTATRQSFDPTYYRPLPDVSKFLANRGKRAEGGKGNETGGSTVNKDKKVEGSARRKRKRAEIEGGAGSVSDAGRTKRKKKREPTPALDSDSDGVAPDHPVVRDPSRSSSPLTPDEVEESSEEDDRGKDKSYRPQWDPRKKQNAGTSTSVDPKASRRLRESSSASKGQSSSTSSHSQSPNPPAPQNGSRLTKGPNMIKHHYKNPIPRLKPKNSPSDDTQSASGKVAETKTTPVVSMTSSSSLKPGNVSNVTGTRIPLFKLMTAPDADVAKILESTKVSLRTATPLGSATTNASGANDVVKTSSSHPVSASITTEANPAANPSNVLPPSVSSDRNSSLPTAPPVTGLSASVTSGAISSGASQPLTASESATTNNANNQSRSATSTPTTVPVTDAPPVGHNSDAEMNEIEAHMNVANDGDGDSSSSFDIASSVQSEDKEPATTQGSIAVNPATDTAAQPDESMEVDEAVTQPPPPNAQQTTPVNPAQPPPTEQPQPESVGLLMSQGNRAKSLHTILLLRDLLQFLRVPGWGNLREVFERRGRGLSTVGNPGMQTQAQTQHGLLEDEEVMTVDQRLDILAHASVAMAQVLFPYRGEELTTKIESLDNRLQQQFDMLWRPEDRPPLRSPESLEKALEDKETQTLLLEALSKEIQTLDQEPPKPETAPPRSLASQETQTVEPVDVSEAAVQTDIEQQETSVGGVRARSNSADAVMVDATPNSPIVPSTTTTEPPTPTAKAMMSIMRNIADLLELDEGGTTTKSVKGKERETSGADISGTSSNSDSNSTVVDAIVNEFKAMKEELREIQKKTHQEFESLTTVHRSEVESLKNELRSRDDRGKDELELIQQRHREELEHLRETIRTMVRDKEKKTEMEDENRIPPLELLELRRRIASLESQARTDPSETMTSSLAASPSVSQFSDHRPSATFHPLGHLLAQDFEDGTPSVSASPASRNFFRENSTPNPGTPVSTGNPFSSSSRQDGMDQEESISNPLPIKSQRKMHMMMFPRSSIG